MLRSRWLHPRPPYVGFAHRLVATSDGCTVRGIATLRFGREIGLVS